MPFAVIRRLQNAGNGLGSCLLCCCLLLGGNSLPIAASLPEFGNARETESPTEENESSAEEAIRLFTRTTVRRKQLRQSGTNPNVQVPKIVSVASPIMAPAGHRLANNLCAPLRC